MTLCIFQITPIWICFSITTTNWIVISGTGFRTIFKFLGCNLLRITLSFKMAVPVMEFQVRGYKNRKKFAKKINISKGILRIGVMVSCQKLYIILVIKWSKIDFIKKSQKTKNVPLNWYYSKKNDKDSDDFWHRKLTLKNKVRDFLTPPHYTNSQNSIIFFLSNFVSLDLKLNNRYCHRPLKSTDKSGLFSKHLMFFK